MCTAGRGVFTSLVAVVAVWMDPVEDRIRRDEDLTRLRLDAAEAPEDCAFLRADRRDEGGANVRLARGVFVKRLALERSP